MSRIDCIIQKTIGDLKLNICSKLFNFAWTISNYVSIFFIAFWTISEPFFER